MFETDFRLSQATSRRLHRLAEQWGVSPVEALSLSVALVDAIDRNGDLGQEDDLFTVECVDPPVHVSVL